MNRVLIIGCCALLAIVGCSKLEGLMTLKRLGDSQKEIETHVDKQEKLFNLLVNDLKAEKLKSGTSETQIQRTYGSPVLTKPAAEPEGSYVLLYRHPTRYFNSDKIYLHFDASRKLTHWEYVPCR